MLENQDQEDSKQVYRRQDGSRLENRAVCKEIGVVDIDLTSQPTNAATVLKIRVRSINKLRKATVAPR